MRLLKIVLGSVFILLQAPSGYAADSFICEFVSRVRSLAETVSQQKAVVDIDKAHYRFDIDDQGSASYRNLDRGWGDPITAIKFGAGWNFIEAPNAGDNLFFVSIFTNKKVENKFPAIMSFHAWIKIDIYRPSQSFGLCWRG